MSIYSCTQNCATSGLMGKVVQIVKQEFCPDSSGIGE